MATQAETSPPNTKTESLVVPTTDTYQHRLATGLGITGGARGSLTRTVGKLAQWQQNTAEEQSSDSDSDNSARDAVVREIQLMQLEMTKLILIQQRQQLELQAAAAESEQGDDLDATRALVQELLGRNKQAASTQSCLSEYEALAVLAVKKHPVSSRALQERLQQVQDECAETETALAKATADVAVRSTQFHSLMQSLLDMKQSLTEPLEESTGNDDGDTEKDSAQPMDVEDGAEEGEELYGDL